MACRWQVGALRACSLTITALITHELEESGIAKQAQAYLTAGGSCLRDPINLAGWGRTAQEVERMSDFYRSKKKQSGFGVGTFRILDLSTPTSVIKNICRTWGVQMVLEVLELIQQRLDQVSTDSSLQDKLNALQPAGDVKAGTLLANNAARLKEELHRIDAVAKRMGREQEPKTNVPRHPRLAKNLFRDSVAILEKNGADERIACIICGTSSTRAFILVPRMPHKGAPSLSLKPTPMPSFDKDEVLLTELSGVEWNSRVLSRCKITTKLGLIFQNRSCLRKCYAPAHGTVRCIWHKMKITYPMVQPAYYPGCGSTTQMLLCAIDHEGSESLQIGRDA